MVVLMKVMRFLGIWKTMDMPCIKVRMTARVRWKKGKSMEIYQLYLRKMIYKK
jgi:hypothetical protein